jgi:tartrate-resistant acid phosphatase type 5
MTDSKFNRRRLLRTAFCSSAALALNLRPTAAAPPASAPASAPDALHLLAIGDFGTTGKFQQAVARAMAGFLEKTGVPLDSMLLLGDNFYGTDTKGFSVDSDRWRNTFEDVYPEEVFNCPCHAVLGNHDYRDNDGGEEVQLAYARRGGTRWRMPAKWYRMDLGGDPARLTILALDSNLQHGKEADAQLAWLADALGGQRAALTMVIGHHPLYSNGSFGDSEALVKAWGPLFEQHGVHAYLCGHDHDLQHLELDGLRTSFVISGGGGARTRRLRRTDRAARFSKDVYGFTHIQVLPDRLVFAHHGIEGELLHRFEKRADGSVAVG